MQDQNFWVARNVNMNTKRNSNARKLGHVKSLQGINSALSKQETLKKLREYDSDHHRELYCCRKERTTVSLMFPDR
jgi:hypothetical protein